MLKPIFSGYWAPSDARNGHVEILRLLLRSSPCRAQPPDAGALQIAARRGHVEVARGGRVS